MAKKIGISLPIRLELCKGELKEQYLSFYNWRVLASNLTYEDAQKVVIEYKRCGYTACPNPEKESGPVYCIYAFDY